jgi:ribosome-associated translation inhibitor RaiA/cold shock CspA family protein
MKLPLQITFRNMDHSSAIEEDIRKRAAKLNQFCDQIMHCNIVVEAGHHHHHNGYLYHVRLDITVPDTEIVVSRERDLHHAHEDIHVAIRDAFDAARRRLEDYTRKHRQDVKTHEIPHHGRIMYLSPNRDYGKIESMDGRSIYFHRNSVLGAPFDQLAVGMEVRFDEEQGDLGPQATNVKVVGKHHIQG